MDAVQCVVLDIEGTTTPISFVHDCLFPYVTAHVDNFVRARWHHDDVRAAVALIREQVRRARRRGDGDRGARASRADVRELRPRSS